MDRQTGGTDAPTFFATLSHELRTPLTGVLGYLELVLESDSLTDEDRRHVEVAHRCGERLLDAVATLITPDIAPERIQEDA